MNATRSTGHGFQESVVFTAISSATLGPTVCKGKKICWGRLERDKKVTLFKSDHREFKQRRRVRLRQRHKARILLLEKGKMLVLHVQHEFPCISLPYSTEQQRKITKF